MGKIHVLEDSLIDKIAAGEVVENPSSVVKELIENSIDAGAETISIHLEKGGIENIQVRDDGAGMTKEDALLSITRHATSKISSEQDLFAIHTLGFRGEALASICAVSDFSLLTRTQDDISGWLVRVHGKESSIEEHASPAGTTITVSRLFHNVPARKKFLRSKESELKEITDIVTRYALAYPNLQFTLKNDGKNVLSTNTTNDWINTIQAIYGSDIAKNMIYIDYHDELFSVKGFIGKPNIARKDKHYQTIFLNGRFIKSKELSNAVKKGYHSMLFLENEPVFVLHVTIDEHKVDVNVHPRKEIVKISLMQDISEHLSIAVNGALAQENLIPTHEIDSFNPRSTKQVHSRSSALREGESTYRKYAMQTGKQKTLVKDESFSDENSFLNKDGFLDKDSSLEENSSFKEDISLEKDSYLEKSNFAEKSTFLDKNSLLEKNTSQNHAKIGPFRVFGQIHHMYIIAESPEGLCIIDQHAAEERINYELLMNKMKDNAVSAQTLVKPLIMELSPAEYLNALHFKEQLHTCGFDIDDHGENTIIVRSVPFVFERASRVLITDLLSELDSLPKNPQKERELHTEVEERIIRFACRKSIKAGDVLHESQMNTLLKKLAECDIPYTCPHGRPTMFIVGLRDIEKKFKRTG
ncbi:MAG: DNA mismatch repair endonuclease MutL [Candidatus Woesearchaeota archaeon]